MTIGAQGGLSQLVTSIADIVEMAGGKHKAAEIRDNKSLSYATTKAGEWFQDKICLFLIDDIWCVNGITRAHIDELLNVAQHADSRIAYTTRDVKVSHGTKIIFRERSRRGTEAKSILETCAKNSYPTSADAQEAFDRILEMCNGLPLALSVCGSAVRELAEGRCSDYPEAAWRQYLRRYEKLPVFAAGDDVNAGAGMEQSVVVSLQFIDEQRCDEESKRWFTSLCVLRNQQFVGTDVLRRLWGKCERETEGIVDSLSRFSIVSVRNVGEGSAACTVGMHDVLLDIARKFGEEENSTVQWCRRVIKSYCSVEERDGCRTRESVEGKGGNEEEGDSVGFEEWWTGVRDDGYIFGNICWLVHLGRWWESMSWLMSNAEWIVKRLVTNEHRQVQEDIQLTIRDVHSTSTEFRANPEQFVGFLEVLHSAVQLGAKRVRESDWEGTAWFEVYGRLIHLKEKNEYVGRFVEELEEKAPRPWLKPSAGCLHPAGDSLRHVIEVDGEPLCHIDLDLNVIVCYKNGNSIFIKRYNTVTGTESTPELVLSGVEYASCAAFSPCGKHLAVGWNDGSIDICKLDAREAGDSGVDRITLSQDDVSRNETEGDESDDEDERGCGLLGWKCFCRGRDFFRRMLSSDSRSGISDECDSVCSEHEVGEVRIGARSVRSLALSWDGKRVMSGYENGNVRVYEKDGEEWVSAALNEQEDSVRSVGICSDGKRVVSGCEDGSVRVWEENGGEWVSVLLNGHRSTVESVAISRDGKRVVSGCEDGSVRVWEMDGEEWGSALLVGHKKEVTSVGISRDGKHVVSGSVDKSVRVWEMDGSEWVSTALNGHEKMLTSVTVSSDGKRVVSGSFNESVRVWENDGEEWVSAPLHGHEDSVTSVAVSSDGKRVVSGSFDKSLRVWENDGEEWVSAPLHGHENSVESVAVSSDGKRIVSGSFDKSVRVWENDGEEWVSAPLHGHENSVESVAVSSDGKRIVSGSQDKSVRVWENDGEEWVSALLNEHEHLVTSVAISNDGRRIVSGSEDKSVRVWENDGEEWVSAPLYGNHHHVWSVAVSSNGNRIATMDVFNRALSWTKLDEWVMTRDSTVDVALLFSGLADEIVSWKELVSDEVIDEIVRPLANEIYTTAYGFFITLHRSMF